MTPPKESHKTPIPDLKKMKIDHFPKVCVFTQIKTIDDNKGRNYLYVLKDFLKGFSL